MDRTCKRNACGFTMVEMLIALTITAMLLTAVAAALNASSANYSANKDIFNASNSTRGALLRITSEIRSAQAVAVSEASTQCSLVRSDGADITYAYDGDTKTLSLITNDDDSDADYVLCKNIEGVTFTKTTLASDSGTVKDVKISMTATVGDVSTTITSGAVLRRNLQ